MSLLNLILPMIFGLCILAALVITFSWLWARMYCKPKRRAPIKTLADYKLPFESVTFNSHGAALRGWLIPIAPSAVRPPTIILAHGWSNNSNQMLPVARALHSTGFAVLLYDARGHGVSGKDGPITIAKFAEDVIAAIGYLEARSDVDATRLGVVGHSMGGSAAILAASADPRIRVVISSSAFADPTALTLDFMRVFHIPRYPFLQLISYFIERWLGSTMSAVAPLNRVGEITVPLLLLHGDSDRFIPPLNMDLLYERGDQRYAKRAMIRGRGHSDILRDPVYSSQIVTFLSKHLSSDHWILADASMNVPEARPTWQMCSA